MLSFKKVFVWHMSRKPWEKVMERYEVISTSFRAIHQRFLDKIPKNRATGRFRHKQN